MLGAIIGDVVGSVYEFNNKRSKNFELIGRKSTFTDDSIMSLAVAKSIIEKKDVVKVMKEYGNKYPSSYGASFYWWLKTNISEPYYSYGNGAAMRVSSCGWLGESEEEVKELTKKVTEVTHNHPEGLKGAEVTAMCIYYSRKGKSKEFIKKYVEQYYNLNFNYEHLKKYYYFNETCQETVPQAIYCFLISKDFEDCLRTSVSIGGDSDTLCCISCSIAEAYYKNIDKDLVKKTLSLLPKEFLKVLKKFKKIKGDEVSWKVQTA